MPGVLNRIFTGVGAQARILGRQAAGVSGRIAREGVAAGWSAMKSSPTLYRTAIGAGIGAVSGGAYAGLTDRSVGGGMLAGAAMGAAGGFGYHMYKSRSITPSIPKSIPVRGAPFSPTAPLGNFTPTTFSAAERRQRSRILKNTYGRRYKSPAIGALRSRRAPGIGANSPYQQRYTAPVFSSNSYGARFRARGRR